MKSMFFALALIVSNISFASEEISPWICPASLEGNVDKISAEIDSHLAKKQLGHAIQIGTVCASFGSNIDVSLLSPVLEALHTALETKISRTENRVMFDLLKKCADRDPNGGSLARSAAAHCQMNVLHGFYSALVMEPN